MVIFGTGTNHIAVHQLWIEIKDISGAGRPLHCQLSLKALRSSSLKKCLICRKSTFRHLFFSIFFSENTVRHCHLVPDNLEIQKSTRLAFSQSQHSKKLFNVIAHKHIIKCNPSNLSAFNIESKKTLALKISYNLLNLSLGLLQICCYPFFDRNKRMQNLSIRYNNTSSFDQYFENFKIANGITRSYVPASSYMFKVNNRNTRTRCETCSKLTFTIMFPLEIRLILSRLAFLKSLVWGGTPIKPKATWRNF